MDVPRGTLVITRYLVSWSRRSTAMPDIRKYTFNRTILLVLLILYDTPHYFDADLYHGPVYLHLFYIHIIWEIP